MVFLLLLDDTNLLEEYWGKKERHKEYNQSQLLTDIS